MGWLWSGSSSKIQGDGSEAMQTSQKPEPATSAARAADIADKPRSLSREEIAQKELQRILREFEAPSTPRPHSNPATVAEAPQPQTSNSQTWTPSTLHPTTMSCTSAFDQAFYCQLLGGQFINYYRNGSLRDCSELWSNFWFCTRTNRGFMSDTEREKRIQNFYKTREARLRNEGSSEDFWEARSEEEIPQWSSQQFKWDLPSWEKGENVLRKGA